MHALNDRNDWGGRVVGASVLTRLYRRLRHSFHRFVLTDMRLPRFAGTMGVVAIFSAASVYGIVAGGHTDDVVNAATSTAGFAVEDIDVVGNHRLSEIDILGALGLDGQTSMIGFDVAHARDVLSQLAWVQSVDVQKVYPGRVRISLVERVPFAVWQHDGEMDIVDGQGRVIVPFRAGLADGLPLLVGRGAEDKARGFMEQMASFPAIYDHARAYIRVGGRRWDVLLDNGVRVKLPEFAVEERLKAFFADADAAGVLSRDVSSVDLRLDDRVTVALTPGAMERRAQTVKELERQEKAKKAGRA